MVPQDPAGGVALTAASLAGVSVRLRAPGIEGEEAGARGGEEEDGLERCLSSLPKALIPAAPHGEGT